MSLLRPYVSKSSIESHQSCGLKYYINYMLGYRDSARKKTILGTAMHSVAESLAIIKKEIQSGKTSGTIKQDDLGEIEWDEISFMFPSLLTEEDVKLINKSRVNKQTYKGFCNVKIGDFRYGREFVGRLIEKAWTYYTNTTIEEIAFWGQEWEKADKTMLVNMVWLLLEALEIRNLWIVDIEKEFDIPIEHPDCKLPNGEYIKVKGFIDLVFKDSKNSNIIQFVDYKSGERKSFESGEEKTLNDLSTDLQLTLYNKVIKQLYPKYNYVVGSILFCRDGGLFTPSFEDNSDEMITKTIHEHIQELKGITELKVLSEQRDDWRCKYLCGASKRMTFSKDKCDCQFVKEAIRDVGIEQTTELYKKDKIVSITTQYNK